MTYKGTVRDRHIELEGGVCLPEGLEVRVVVAEGARGPMQHGRGSPQAVLGAFDKPARCTPEDVEALLSAIAAGKRPVQFTGPFDTAGSDR